MPPVKKPATAVAASQELAGGRKATWRGIEFDLPAILPADIAWTMAEIEASTGNQLAPVLRLFNQLLGDDQVAIFREKLREDKVELGELDKVLQELMEPIFAAYGTAEGELPASE